MASLAVEGLPGAGKTTIVTLVVQKRSEVRLVPGIVLELPRSSSAEFFSANDRAKAEIVRAAPIAVLDRYWPSTVAYRRAELRYRRRAVPPVLAMRNDVLGGDGIEPTAYLFIDDPAVVADTSATDGLWPDPAFRRLVHAAYFEIFAKIETPVFIARNTRAAPGSLERVAAVVLALLDSPH